MLTTTLNETTSITTRVKDASHGPLELSPTSKAPFGEENNSDSIAEATNSERMEQPRSRRSSSHRTDTPSLVRELLLPSTFFNVGIKVFGHNAREAKTIFNAGLLKTFGKLNQPDIARIDGRAERLIAELVEQYGWNEDFAKQKTEAFEVLLSIEPAPER